jgi:hypothetical protein
VEQQIVQLVEGEAVMAAIARMVDTAVMALLIRVLLIRHRQDVQGL